MYWKTPVPEPFFKKSCSPEDCNFIKKETLAHVLSCKFCEISKNTFSYRTPPVAASITIMKMKTKLRKDQMIST